MTITNRSNNLDLIRWMSGGHEPTAGKMAHITNANYVSKMATGEMDISDHVARSIEKAFSLPEFWMDRDNENAIKMPKEDYELHSTLQGLPQNSKNILRSFLLSLEAGAVEI
ncbi:hypothetical protein PS1M3_17400 [Pseudoalteromonas sp. PS1M3]|jgi:plasmid maintenance system antidote protein VapI|uniref:hypothetical protein n=1 Tax=unclassified Pseudoalteromonas TaxID=194690 RepID=UPI0005189D1C|nr:MULTISPECIES: hypothetical protein [unclassified Pseudoalteromonas]MBL1385193.1 hypothetical protein [Colwellia sp.]TMS79568.1 hypothetical protein CWB65_19515 [Pseudoalteromonas sp. S554]BBW91653.1 hypothetical protein PS1M3_17400 [Pseudoalteromonas sp. PS1M3]|tara:strand:- start:701 stop:1036 length:336 start_codon:yes stop_codon:yes gene_type:complete